MNDEEKEKETARKEAEERAAKEKAAADANSDEGKSKIVEEAKKAAIDIKEGNIERRKILDREEKVLDRKESLKALGGGSPAGNTPAKPSYTQEEKESRARIKQIADSNNSDWAKKYE